MTLELYKNITGVGTVIILVIIVTIGIFRIVAGADNVVFRTLKKHALPIGFFSALVATAGSLIYSNVFGLTPCTLCWWQRILIYPQVLLIGLAWYLDKKAKPSVKNIFIFSLPLAIIGTLISAYHILLQRGIISGIGECIQGSVSCATIDLQALGSVTIPVMAFAIGLCLIVIGAVSINKKTV